MQCALWLGLVLRGEGEREASFSSAISKLAFSAAAGLLLGLLLAQEEATAAADPSEEELADAANGSSGHMFDDPLPEGVPLRGDAAIRQALAELDAFIEALEKGVILETVRTGASGVGRGDRILKVQ